MTEKMESHGCYRCRIRHHPGWTSVPCAQPAGVDVDGLMLCERHALEASLEGRIACWDEILFHIDLWSREANRRNRVRIVRLLGVQRREAASAMKKAREDLARCRSAPLHASGNPPTRGLPPKDARPPFRGNRRR